MVKSKGDYFLARAVTNRSDTLVAMPRKLRCNVELSKCRVCQEPRTFSETGNRVKIGHRSDWASIRPPMPARVGGRRATGQSRTPEGCGSSAGRQRADSQSRSRKAFCTEARTPGPPRSRSSSSQLGLRVHVGRVAKVAGHLCPGVHGLPPLELRLSRGARFAHSNRRRASPWRTSVRLWERGQRRWSTRTAGRIHGSSQVLVDGAYDGCFG